MGLTFQSTHGSAFNDLYKIDVKDGQNVIALAGNPNTGKSTVFNTLTGLHQHTGNWPGKTVVNAIGEFKIHDSEYVIVDLPGTYSLFPSSQEEEVARDFICFGNSDLVVVVADATCLERNLNLVYQIMELTDKIILCINLIDEAKKKNIIIDQKGLEAELGIPVVLCAARNGYGIRELKDTIHKVIKGDIKPKPKSPKYSHGLEELIESFTDKTHESIGKINSRWVALRVIDGDTKLIDALKDNLEENVVENISLHFPLVSSCEEKVNIRDQVTEEIFKKAEELNNTYVKIDTTKANKDRKIDKYITSKIFGLPLMLLTLALVFWITISGANIPSQFLADLFFGFEDKLTKWFEYMNAPEWLHGVLVLGLYRTLAWVISVMLPPMAIFFPLFTILEDLGYLPRVAFNMDHLFKKACAHGKQCLTMCMGFGCNAAGIISCRIIDSPRERLIAILTNNFVPCNGRFPMLIAISTVFLVSKGPGSGLLAVLSVTALIVLGIIITLLVSYLLSKTILKGVPSTFTLELPPYRVPKIGRVLYTSLIDRTIFVLSRAILVAAPVGAVTWILSNIIIGDLSIIAHIAAFLDPLAKTIGLDGYILMAFILGLPANEIVLPILLMSYLSTGTLVSYDSIDSLREILINNNWTYLTALNFMLFSLLHWPCATTLMTIKKETGSMKWTILSALIPTSLAFIICFLTTLISKILTAIF
ncbi:MAG: ferrous iron transport protein B [Clostridiales bacterium]|nr:ferrous iron transport protein B [Clostridiales bacterium]